ncbi:helix-turn-helix transcriptional regulator [Hufsiella ginkgonis]|uniref:Helix-turn-helix domain-containing protein n=1 Tax=Hufsiella ginkgonis TaxID=2695274 RepID=A0A7K1XU63_9SPHI|nr:AraC family transcriptional regulator [Hufsiella ginkgonis]MXV14524.1 helix-turn-helix domain-containing protein [Hufsiella ginkgonis]
MKRQTIPNILLNFADLLGTTVKDNRLEIPGKFGRGYCAGFMLNEHIRMLISNYELNEPLTINNPDIDTTRKIIFFKFQNIFPKAKSVLSEKPVMQTPSVLVATSRINTDELISVHTNIATVTIEVDATYLNGLFTLPEESHLLQSLLENTQPLLFEQLIHPSLQKIVHEMVNEPINGTFESFFLRVKAEELICRLLTELEKRDKKYLYPLNGGDIQAVYQVRDQLLEHLETPPVITALAVGAGMSPTKLKRLFSQIFGNSIFNYYQGFRIKEAARLLREEKLSVSAAGYKLGYTNLSHFSRVFEEHIGVKPKKYSAM